jgi:hypothetical protein
MKCSRCGALLTGGVWNIPTERGLLQFCPACVAPPRVMGLFNAPAIDVRCGLRTELMGVGARNRR